MTCNDNDDLKWLEMIIMTWNAKMTWIDNNDLKWLEMIIIKWNDLKW